MLEKLELIGTRLKTFSQIRLRLLLATVRFPIIILMILFVLVGLFKLQHIGKTFIKPVKLIAPADSQLSKSSKQHWAELLAHELGAINNKILHNIDQFSLDSGITELPPLITTRGTSAEPIATPDLLDVKFGSVEIPANLFINILLKIISPVEVLWNNLLGIGSISVIVVEEGPRLHARAIATNGRLWRTSPQNLLSLAMQGKHKTAQHIVKLSEILTELAYRITTDNMKEKGFVGVNNWSSLRHILEGLDNLSEYEVLKETKGERKWQALRSAKRNFHEAVMQDPKSFLAHYNLAVCYMKIGQLDNAIRELNESISLNPHFILARISLGGLYRTVNRSYKALHEWKRSSEIASNIRLKNASLLGALNYNLCKASLWKMEETLNPNQLHNLYEQGTNYCNNSLRYFTVTSTPENTGVRRLIEAHNLLARIQLTYATKNDKIDEQKKNEIYKAAEKNFSISSRLVPDNVEAALGLGDVRLQLNDLGKADENYHRARKLAPGSPVPLIRRANVLVKSAQAETVVPKKFEFQKRSILLYQAALRRDPTSIAAYKGLSEIHADVGRLDLSESYDFLADLFQANLMRGQSLGILRDFAKAEQNPKKRDLIHEAIAWLDRSIQGSFEQKKQAIGVDAANATDPYAFFLWGGTFLTEGSYEDAIRAFNEVIRHDSWNEHAKFGLSLAYLFSGRLQEAVELLVALEKTAISKLLRIHCTTLATEYSVARNLKDDADGREKLRAAIDSLRVALLISVDDPYLLFSQGVYHDLLREGHQAKFFLQEPLRIDPGFLKSASFFPWYHMFYYQALVSEQSWEMFKKNGLNSEAPRLWKKFIRWATADPKVPPHNLWTVRAYEHLSRYEKVPSVR